MPRRSPLTSLCAFVVSLGVLLAGPAALAAGPPSTVDVARTPLAHVDSSKTDPLELTIQRLTPAVVTGERDVVISGTVTNTSDETWRDINIAPFRSAFPITDTSTLNAAADLPDDEYVGDRLVDAAAIFKVVSLAPGASSIFTARIPRDRLGRSNGVYWVGVHASGVTDTQPRDDFTDGRARTFLPVADADVRPLRTSVVLPLKADVRHTADGRIDGTDDWVTLLGPGGRLASLLDVAESTDVPITWLVDPAVPHAVSRLAAGNPGWSLAALPREQPSEAPRGDEERTPAPSLPVLPSDSPTESEGPDPEMTALAALASAWLERFTTAMSSAEVLALPYGDVDVAALSAADPDFLKAAYTRSSEVLDALGVRSTPVVTSPDGRLTRLAVETSPDAAVVLLGERGLTTDEGPLPTTGTVLGHDFAATSAGISRGGPGPGPASTAVGVRQRVVSEAVLRELAGDRTPLVVLPPTGWDAADAGEELFAALQTRRFRMRPLGTLLAQADGPTLGARSLVHTDDDRAAQVPRTQIDAALELVDRAGVLESVLTNPSGFDLQVRDTAWSDLANQTRRRPALAMEEIAAGVDHVDDLLGSITVSGPDSARLSGDGTIGATVANDLDVSVTVDVAVTSTGDVRVEVPNPVTIPSSSRRRLLLPTSTGREGVQSLTLRVTDAEGEALGSRTTVQVRASETSGLLWLIVGSGAIVLFGTIILRLRRRGLATRSQLEEQQEPSGQEEK
ncbi:hypothetical protein [Nocardioides jishulii]|uniref:Glycoprotein n=1 Tax=Nocardioides jishulii TaxID=2575440 RepID=A0A4U2YTU3_9ACTN|nr:hypothetical protein [Nocardioides jishulii]QCX28987.1 hypothetical protein FCL41_16770 [Nocardioides jishulii]TKI64112.1 hypothetical protein FC770_02795 [Nocardioides jishulii]